MTSEAMYFDIQPLLVSLKTSVVAILITVLAGIFVALKMSGRRGKLAGIVDGILTLPMVLPPTVAGFFLLLLLGRQGPLGGILDYFNTTLIFSWWATVLSSTVVAFPIMYKAAKGAIEQVDENILNAARTLGAKEHEVFLKVMFPVALPGLAAATALSFARIIGEFGATIMIAGNISGQTQTIPLAIYFAAESGDYKTAMLWVVVICIISLSIMLLINLATPSRNKHK